MTKEQHYPKYTYRAVNIDTGEEFEGNITEIIKNTGLKMHDINNSSILDVIVKGKWKVTRYRMQWKVILPWGKVKFADSNEELSGIFGYSSSAIYVELANNGNGTAFGCRLERVCAD